MAEKKPHTLWFTHTDGRWLEVVLEDFQQLYHLLRQDDHPGGLYLGSEPACDVVLDGDDVEGFHALYFGAGHHTLSELIAGRPGANDYFGAMYPGDVTRGDIPVGGWKLANPTEADAIRAQVGHVRVEVAPRTAIPAPLAEAESVLRIRVEDAAGATEIHTIGSIERLARGVTIGADPDCDLVLPSAGRNRIALIQRQQLWFEVRACAAAPAHTGAASRSPVREGQLDRRWSRLRIGDAIVQLCRWPGRYEPLR